MELLHVLIRSPGYDDATYNGPKEILGLKERTEKELNNIQSWSRIQILSVTVSDELNKGFTVLRKAGSV